MTQNFSLPPASPEQQRILKALAPTQTLARKTRRSPSIPAANVLVNAVAGSGKTTTILHIARAYPRRRTLLLTYNARLKEETRVKKEILQLMNLEVHNYNSFAVKYFGKACWNDEGLFNALEQLFNMRYDPLPLNVKEITYRYDLLILDEAQDMIPIYYALVCLLQRYNPRMQICFLGDQHQCIYRFKGADERFMLLSQQLFASPWGNVVLPLSTSYRLTEPMAWFLNECLIGAGPGKIQGRPGPALPVRYLTCDLEDETLENLVREYLKTYSPQEIFILAPSVRPSGGAFHLKRLSNRLSKRVCLVHMQEDETACDERILREKLVFSTYHSAKGLERPLVIVLNFDDSYAKFIEESGKCPNALYVALTRAQRELCVVHNWRRGFLPCLRLDRLFAAEQAGYVRWDKKREQLAPIELPTLGQKAQVPDTVSVSELLRYLPLDVMMAAQKYFGRKLRRAGNLSPRLAIPTIVEQGSRCEEVSAINGVAIPAYFDWELHGELQITQLLPLQKQAGLKLFDRRGQMRIPELLRAANLYLAYRNDVKYKCYQIKQYDWLKSTMLEEAVVRMRKYCGHEPNKVQAEVPLQVVVETKIGSCKLMGCLDIVSQKESTTKVFEIKCVQELGSAHFLQLALYMYLCQKTNATTKKTHFYLFNVLTEEIWQIAGRLDKLEEMVCMLLEYKYGPKTRCSDEEFLRRMYAIRAQWFNDCGEYEEEKMQSLCD